jgi:hypothetical protein
MAYQLQLLIACESWFLLCHTLLLNRTAVYFVLQMHGANIVLLNLVTCSGEDVCSWNSTISGSHMQHGYTVLVHGCWVCDNKPVGEICLTLEEYLQKPSLEMLPICVVCDQPGVRCVLQCLATILRQFGQRLLSTSRLQLTNLNVTK